MNDVEASLKQTIPLPAGDASADWPKSWKFLPAVRSLWSIELQMVLAALALALGCLAFSEQVPVNGGFGWDGVAYGGWARDFYNAVFVRGLNSYYIGRILPSAIVHYGLRALSLARSDANRSEER